MAIELREVRREDLGKILEMRNNPTIREKMFNSKSITQEEHLTYWEKRLSDPLQLSYMILLDGVHVGFAKIDRVGGGGEVGLFIEPATQGMGVGKEAISQLIEMARKNGIVQLSARVKPDNVASEKVFMNCGFEARYTYLEIDI